MDNKTFFLTELLKCGYEDLEMLEDVKTELLIDALQENLQEHGLLYGLNDLMRTVFNMAIVEIDEVFHIEAPNNNLSSNFSGYYNCQDTHAYLYVADTISEQTQEEINTMFYDLTGFELSFQ